MKKILSRRGSTLAELVIVMALVAIASLIIVSFSSMAYSFADRNEEEYLFLEECADAEEAIRDFFAEKDTADRSYLILPAAGAPVGAPKTRFAFLEEINGTQSRVYAEIEGGVLKVNAVPLATETITEILFEEYTENLTNANALIRCTLRGEGAREQSFLLVLRCATPEVNADA